MRPARLILMVSTVAGLALVGVLSAQQAKPARPMQILEHVKSVSGLPIKYLLNTHHHTDHAGGDAVFINTTEIIAHRNVRENFLRNKPGALKLADLGWDHTVSTAAFNGGLKGYDEEMERQ